MASCTVNIYFRFQLVSTFGVSLNHIFNNKNNSKTKNALQSENHTILTQKGLTALVNIDYFMRFIIDPSQFFVHCFNRKNTKTAKINSFVDTFVSKPCLCFKLVVDTYQKRVTYRMHWQQKAVLAKSAYGQFILNITIQFQRYQHD